MTMARSVVTPVAGLVATAPETFTRWAAMSSLACSRERARPRRTSSASSRRRRGGTAGSGGPGLLVGRGRGGLMTVEGAPQQLVRCLEHADVLLEGAFLEALDRCDHGVHVVQPGADRLRAVELRGCGHAPRLPRRRRRALRTRRGGATRLPRRRATSRRV